MDKKLLSLMFQCLYECKAQGIRAWPKRRIYCAKAFRKSGYNLVYTTDQFIEAWEFAKEVKR